MTFKTDKGRFDGGEREGERERGSEKTDTNMWEKRRESKKKIRVKKVEGDSVKQIICVVLRET